MKFSINSKITFLIVAAILSVAFPLLYISEEMYQEHITEITNDTSKALITQLILSQKTDATNWIHFDTFSSSDRLLFFFDKTGTIQFGSKNNTSNTLAHSLVKKLNEITTTNEPIAIPVTTNKKNPKGWDCVAGFAPSSDLYSAICYARDYTYDASNKMQTFAGLLSLLVIGIGFFCAKQIVTKITAPLRRLSNYARSLPNKQFSSNGKSFIHEALDKNNDKEINELITAFSYMEGELTRYIHNEKKAATERERIHSELRIAAEIQLGALPSGLNIEGEKASIQAHMLPAREVGGDLYDYFMLDEKTLIFSIGDVSGKGVPAALFMFATQYLLRSIATPETPIVQLASQLNETLSQNNPSAMFVTMLLGRFDFEKQTLEFVLAGHPPPFLKNAIGEIQQLKAPANLPIGNITGFPYVSKIIKLSSGESLIGFTDGVTEAINSNGEFYGLPQLAAVIQKSNGKCETIIENVFSSISSFTTNIERHDDITVLCFTIKKD